MLVAILMLLQPAPMAAYTPSQSTVTRVDLIIVNQYIACCESNDGPKWSTVWYTSTWMIHDSPPWGMCRTEWWEHCGWTVTTPIVRCSDGWATEMGRRTVSAARLVFIVSDYDFEYRNR